MSFRAPVRNVLLAGAALLVILFCRRHFSSSASAANLSGEPATPVLVELFTSEGCSDCPPADALLSRLQQTQPISGANVIILEEHVDYWDRLGWKDPFSSAMITARQAGYADAHGGQQVYTPQMIVDGQAEFVGSSTANASAAIAFAASSRKPSINLLWTADGKLSVGVASLAGTANGEASDVYVAVTENMLHTNVSHGENAGRTLEHNGVVRQLQQVGKIEGAAKQFTSTVSLPANRDWNRSNLRAVVFVQGQRDLRVLAVAQVPFPTS